MCIVLKKIKWYDHLALMNESLMIKYKKFVNLEIYFRKQVLYNLWSDVYLRVNNEILDKKNIEEEIKDKIDLNGDED